MQRVLSSFGAVCTVALVSVSYATAAPVATKNFAGKKICWSSSVAGTGTSTFGPGSKFVDTVAGVGTWSLTAAGIQVATDRYNFLEDIHKLPDGTFSYTTAIGR